LSNEPKFCGKCGTSLKDNVRFCTNCGTEINADIAIKRITRDEFLNRYHGTRILDHINEIINSNIGDKQRLEAIHHLIESKQELDYVNFFYLKECSDKYNTITKPSEITTRPNIPKRKTTFSKYKIIGIMVIAVFVSMIVISASISSNDSDSNEKSTYEIEEDKAKEIVKIVQEYRGKDGKGNTVLDALTVLINVSYRNENILDNPATEIGWYGTKDLSFLDDNGIKDGIYKIMFFVKTYKENIEFVWYYNIQTGEIFAGNEHGKSVLEIVDTFD
jgi:hypothetical protein